MSHQRMDASARSLFNQTQFGLWVCLFIILIFSIRCGGGSSGTTIFLPDAIGESLTQLRDESLTDVSFLFSNGIPEVVSMKIPVSGGLGDDAVLESLDFLERYKNLYSLPDPKLGLYLKRVSLVEDNNQKHLFYGQKHDGYPVFGAELAVHIIDGFVVATNGMWLADIPTFSEPTVSSADATTAAINNAPGTDVASKGVPKLMYYDASLLDQTQDVDTHLTWRISLSGISDVDGNGRSWLAFVDAFSGEVLTYLNQTPSHKGHSSGKDFDIQAAFGTSDLCFPFTDTDDWFDENGSVGYPGVSSDAFNDGINAFNHAHTVYNYFFNTFGRHSWDGKGEQVNIFVHNGNALPSVTWFNAAFRGNCMAFGESLVQLDIMAHEWGHAIDDNMAELEYIKQSGALDESLADFWALMITDDPVLGEGISPLVVAIQPPADNAFIPFRDMSNPPMFGHPDHMSNFDFKIGVDEDSDSYDSGGVHTNSGIINKALYLMVKGGTHNGITVMAVGPSKMEQLVYEMELNWYSSNTSFTVAADLMGIVAQLFALNKTHDFTDDDACDVRNAWASVGLLANKLDTDCDGTPDVVDPDDDNDGKSDGEDNCPIISNPSQSDNNGDGEGDACDDDIDGDGKKNNVDNCDFKPNFDQEDFDNDGIGDVCDDSDGDGKVDKFDNCPNVSNPNQKDTDGDGDGNACDDDDDDDGKKDDDDNCPLKKNFDQANGDSDTLGDVCDNCPSDTNEDQIDCDNDGKGEVCDDNELPQPGNCGEFGFVTINRFVHPLDKVSIGCPNCGDWLTSNHKLSVIVSQPVTTAFVTKTIQIVDDLGRVVKEGTTDFTQTISFYPKASFHYRVPNSEDEVFQGILYFVQFPESEDGNNDAFEVGGSVDVEVEEEVEVEVE